MKCSVLIVDNHAILREGLRALIAAEADFSVAGDADNGRDAVRLAVELEPGITLMDLSMPGTSGIQAIADMKRRVPATKILVLTIHDTEEYVRAALDAGADGYALKDDSHAELMIAIRGILAGKTYLSPNVCGGVVDAYLRGAPQVTEKSSWGLLTQREREVLKLIAEGNKNKEIAEYLSLSPKTIEKHRANLMRKLGLSNVSAVTTYAITRHHHAALKQAVSADVPVRLRTGRTDDADVRHLVAPLSRCAPR